jgi:CheY-like chemotaxis protein
VVDDSPEFLSLVGDLVSPPTTVDCFDSPDTTVDDIALRNPSLVIVDLKLGGGAVGWQLLVDCCQDQRLAGVPLVLCSADVRGLDEHRDEVASLHRVSILRKPFTIEEFEQLLARALPASAAI